MRTGVCVQCSQKVTTTDSDWPNNEHYGHNPILWQGGKPQPIIAETAPIATIENNPTLAPALVDAPTTNVAEPFSFEEDSRLMRRAMHDIGNIIFERELQIKQLWCALIAQSSMIAYGGPGTGKSDLNRVFSQSVDRSYWDTNISATTTEDNLFGPYDLLKMRNEGVWERAAKGMLTHQIVFLDELGNASGMIRDAIKTAINERVYRSGDIEIKLPLELLIAASNSQLIDTEAKEEAFADRFLIRTVVHRMQDDENIVNMLMNEQFGRPFVNQIDGAVITRMQNALSEVRMTREFMASAQNLRKQIEADPAAGSLEITDRRLARTMRLVAAHALLNGRKVAKRADLIVFGWTFWSDPENEERPLQEYLKAALQGNLTLLESYQSEVDSTLQSWIAQKQSPTPMPTAEFMANGTNTRAVLQGIGQQLKMVRPKLDDQEEVDLANQIERDIEDNSKAILKEIWEYSEQAGDTDTILNELKKG